MKARPRPPWQRDALAPGSRPWMTAREITRGAFTSEARLVSRLAELIEDVVNRHGGIEQDGDRNGTRIDLFVPRRRFVGEVKKRIADAAQGKAQLAGYVEELRRKALDEMVPEGEEPDDPALPWTGVLTDGQRWFIARWPHRNDAGHGGWEARTANTPEELAALLDELLDGSLTKRLKHVWALPLLTSIFVMMWIYGAVLGSTASNPLALAAVALACPRIMTALDKATNSSERGL